MAPEEDGREDVFFMTIGELNLIHEIIEDAAREAEATSSVVKMEIVTKVLSSEVRELEKDAAMYRIAEHRKILRRSMATPSDEDQYFVTWFTHR